MTSEHGYSMADRLWGVLASLFFSVPTALLIWLFLNQELASFFFIQVAYLLGFIFMLAMTALLVSRLFPDILGAIWRGIMRLVNSGWA